MREEDIILEKIQKDPYFIAIKKYGYDIRTLEQRYPDGCPEHIIAAALRCSEDEVERAYRAIAARLKKIISA